MIYHVALYMCWLHVFAAAFPFAFPQYREAARDIQRGGQESSQEKQCHCYIPLPGHAAIVCTSCSLSKCGINAG